LDTAKRKHAWAAVGQPLLMNLYNSCAKKYHITMAQCLILRSDFMDKERYDNFVATVEDLLAAGVLPVINENDVVAMPNVTASDNDLLSAMVAIALGAQKLVLFTNQKGLYSANPESNPTAELIPLVKDVDFELEKLCRPGELSTLGKGGMLSKIRAAKQAVNAGIETCIADGRASDALAHLFDDQFEGTRFISAYPVPNSSYRRWLMAAKGCGQIIIDEGAVRALNHNKSLLLPGITNIKGLFDKGEIVEVISREGIAVAYGKTNYGNKEIQTTLTLRKKSAKRNLTLEREVIHRNYMTTLNKA
jgi:glutamate 5-kinase